MNCLSILGCLAMGAVIALGANPPSNGILREVWEGIPGNDLGALTNAPAYPAQPTSTNYVSDLFEAPTDVLEEYGQRMHGYVVPPRTGAYTFWIASDDNGALFLSSDESPARAQLIASVNSWTSSREWEKEANQRSSPVNLTAGRPYYIAALMKEGGGGDNLAVRWLMPDGTDQAPIVATNLLPYGISFAPPVIASHPTNTTVIEGDRARFSVTLSTIGLYTYRWQRNGIAIAGADEPELVYGPVRLGDHQARFRCVVTNALGSAASNEAVLSVLPDTTPPTLAGVRNLGLTRLEVAFSEPVADSTALDSANYSLDGGLVVTAVNATSDPRVVELVTAAMTYGHIYTLTVNRVTDLAATPNVIAPDSQASYTVNEFVPADVGSPALAGTTVSVPGGVDVTGAGKTIGGTADQFQFGWQERTGNFDFQTRIEAVTVSDPFLHAGLMARETLDANARFAGVFAGSHQLGCFFESRTTTGGNSTTAAPRGGFPVNHPSTWLRLQRAGTALQGYASLDGRTWTPLGSATLSGLAPKVYLGFAVTSDSETTLATARFRDPGVPDSTATGAPALNKEPIGPSSRATGMVISEIMYHPPPRDDGRNLEFVELYNARSVFEDLTGWRLSGEVSYRFPPGFRLQAGETVVIAASPDDIRAVYGITNVLGPYTGALANDGGQIRLRNNADAIRIEIVYSDASPWPAADGAGHSLVLARPSYGEADPRAWAASEFRGGSPGGPDPTVPAPETSIVINEFLAHTDEPMLDFIELHNRSNDRVDLSHMVLTDRPHALRFRIPEGTWIEPRGFLAWDQTQLGFALNSSGETVYLINAAGTRVLDAIRFGAQENGVSSGRASDGAPTIRRLAQPTPGAANAPWRIEDVVINELMYNPISGDNNDEFIEIYNRLTTPLDLTGWRFVQGVDYTFPAGVTLPANGYLVVARNAARLRTHYPHLNNANCVGDFEGSLSNRGERLALARPDLVVTTNATGRVETNVAHIVVSEVTYADGGRWGQWTDGGGSSLELIDPRADLLRPSNWADSDETSKAPWTTVETTGRIDNSSGTANRLRVALLGGGECLVDDIEVFRAGSTNVVNNGDFESGQTGWVFSGNHSTSTVDTTGAAGGTRCLHVRGQGDGDTGPNTLRNTLRTSLANNSTVTIRAKVRWLAGWPQILFRLHGNGLELAANMAVPPNLGTPGLPNSRLVANAGPAIHDVAHAPPLPAANEPVRVTCRVSDPDRLAQVQLRYRIDPASTLTTVIMRDDGAQGDERAGDGLFSAILPAQPAGTLAAFRIIATDAGAPAASATFPARAPAEECLVRWGDAIPFGTFAHYHLWFTRATANARQNALDNTYRDSTLVCNHHRVIYNTGFRDKGSPYHGGAGDIAATTPRDEPLLGAFDRVFASTGNGGSEATGIRSQLAAWYAQQLGIPYLHAHYMRLYFNGSLFRPDIMEDLEQPNHDYAERWFPTGDEGDLYKIAVWFEFSDDNRNFQATGATAQRFITLNNEYKLARYRWNFQRRSNDGDASNYGQFLDLVTALNDTSPSYVSRVSSQADMEQWMRAFCFDYAMGNWDAWTYNVGQNMYLCRPLAQRWVLIPWDIDFVFGLGDGTSGPLRGGGQDPTMSRAYSNAEFLRMNWRAYQDTINGPFLPANFQPQIDARRAVLLKNNVTGITAPGSLTTWINSRRTYIGNQLNAADPKTFEITTNGGADFQSTTPTATLAGTAPIAVATIEINGVPYPIASSNVRSFSVTVPLTQQTNSLTLVGKDLRRNPVPAATDTIEVRYTGAIERIEDFVVINEVHYDAAPSEPASTFIELFNRSSSTPFDLSGCVLQGVGYTFPNGTLIAPRSFLVLARNRPGFEAVYGRGVPVFDLFPGSLDNDGERLALIQPGGAGKPDLIVSDLRYWDRLPWPTNAAGLGPSLQLVDANHGSWRVGNWAATPTNHLDRATPARANATAQTLAPFPPVWLNEVQPNNVAGPRDSAGDRDPWIELYNAGAETVDLSLLDLTDAYTDLTRWRFPAGTTLGPGQFLVVWADGEPGESRPGEPHANFRLAPDTGTVALCRLQGSPAAPAAIDSIEYNQLSAGRSLGSLPDGEPRARRPFVEVTPGAPNNPALPAVPVRINELMASNTRTIADPSDNDFDDWFELYNAGSTPADLTGYTLTDTLDNPAKYTIPSGTVVPPGGYLLVWADEESAQNTPGGDLHVNFRLALAGEQIGLFDINGLMVDAVTFIEQTDDVSLGRYPDGGEPPLYEMTVPTPRQPNYLEGGNRPPLFTPIPDRAVDEGQPLQFTAVATDPDAGQTVRYALSPDAPPAATIDTVTGEFFWIPAEADGPARFTFSIFATDDGNPARTGIVRVTVGVAEVNLPPVLEPIPDQVADENTLFTLQLVATDPDLPPKQLRFLLEPGGPEDATLTEDGGFAWTPPAALGGSTVSFTVRVTDQGEPPLNDAATFRVTIRDVPSPPDVPFIDPQFIDEGALFQFTVPASDPDSPPAPLYFAFDQAPANATIDQSSGLIAWPTTEETGPTNAIFVVRVVKLVEPFLSTVRTFSVTVRELNQPPVLLPIASRIAREGEWIVIQARASDADLPPQRLTFSLAPGAPADARIAADAGLFTWSVPADFGPSTHAITVRVADDAEDAKSATQSFTVTVVAEPRIVINEIMYRPLTPGAAYVELHNWSTNATWDLSGWRLAGASFLFPDGTTLGPGAYLAVAQNTTAFTAAYGPKPNVLGNFSNQLGPDGGAIALYRPIPPASESLVDRVAFRASAPWPTVANGGGPSLQLIDSRQDNARVANWTAVTGPATNTQRGLVPIDASWRYWQQPTDPAPGWSDTDYNDSTWPAGRALLYVESADLPAPKNMPLTLGQMSYFFRHAFTFDGNPQGARLLLRPVIDDGAVFYLNGEPIFWLGMAEGEIPERDTPSTRSVGDAAYEGPFEIPVANLRLGANVLAVEVHQVNATSTDIVMGASVDVIEMPREQYTPAYANSTRATLAPFPDLWINEVLPLNETGLLDNAGDRDPWIELANFGLEPAAMGDWFLSNTYADPARWPFPNNASIAAGQFKLVWADAEPAETTAVDWHANFRLVAPSGVVVLSRLQQGQPAVVDFLEYTGLAADQSFGYPAPRLEDTAAVVLPEPTPGVSNLLEPPAPPELLALEVDIAGAVTLRWTTVPGWTYRVEASRDAGIGAWNVLGAIAATGIEASFTDTSAAERDTRFYRVALVW